MSYSNWYPFELACRLSCLSRATSGNTQQRIAALKSLCVTEANGAAGFARWNPTLTRGTVQALEVKPSGVPGYVAPVHS